MRRCLSLFLVLLLALRGLLGDAMAMQMVPAAPSTLSASHTTGHSEHAASAVSLRSNHGMTDATHDSSATHCATAPSADHCGHNDSSTHCSTCTMCHAAWCLHSLLTAPPALPTGMLPSPRAAAFASAALRSLIKPPIV